MKTLILAAVAALSLTAGAAFAQGESEQDATWTNKLGAALLPQTAPISPVQNAGTVRTFVTSHPSTTDQYQSYGAEDGGGAN